MTFMSTHADDRPSGWWFPVRTTAYFLVVAALSLAVLSLLGLQQLRSVNEDDSGIRVDRAARSAAALLQERIEGATVALGPKGSPRAILLDATMHLTPSASWDELLDVIGGVNQGAANLFHFNDDSQSFDRLSTTFRTPDGARIGGSQVEPGLISAGHPAFASLTDRTAYVGQVPVAGRMRLAYLTPILDSDGSLAGSLAVDVGWVDDLTRINQESTKQALFVGLILLGMLAAVCVIVMFFSFRPLRRLTEVAHALGSLDGDRSISLTERRDEIGYLAKGLAKVAELQESLEYRAYNDALTGVPNRAALVQELEQRFDAISLDDPNSGAFAILIIDLDGFKEVNDGLGHQAGDELLVALATSLRDCMRPGEFIARLGGDEFALLSAVNPPLGIEIDELAQRASAMASGVFQTSAGEARVTVSIGIALIPQHGITSEQAMSKADLALYEVKRSGRGASMIYEHALAQSFQRRLHVAEELRQALDEQKLRLEYQPLHDKEGHMCGVEALARWQHETEGYISPVEFIPIAENVGLIGKLGSWAIEEACRQIDEWSQSYVDVPMVSVNVSVLQLNETDFISDLREVLERYPTAAGRLCFELTESVLVNRENGQHQQVLSALSEMGVKLAIDDFGTGYSSLNYLHQLVVDQVKIDRSFVVSAVEDHSHVELLAGIVGLGKGLGLSVVLEGIETEQELELAQGLDCDLMQGFLLGRPMTADAVAQRFGVTHAQFKSESNLANVT